MADKPRRPTKRAQSLCKNATDQERLLWLELRKSRFDGHKFSRQIPIGPYICDCICRRQKLVIELDGGQHSANVAGDAARTRFIESAGYRVVRFWNHEVTENLEGVLHAIGATLGAGPPPDPLPVREGEE